MWQSLQVLVDAWSTELALGALGAFCSSLAAGWVPQQTLIDTMSTSMRAAALVFVQALAITSASAVEREGVSEVGQGFAGLTTAPKPNVLLITLDDFRPELPVFGREWLHTPALDSIAARGTAFLRAYVQAPQCCPTRNSFLVRESHHFDVLALGLGQ
jgi:hypothetical protein